MPHIRCIPFLASILAAAMFSGTVHAEVRITEIMFEGKGLDTVEFKKDGVTPNYKVIDDKREFFEITNLGSTAVNINGWVYDDDKVGDSHTFGNQFGTLAAGESLIFTELTSAQFRTQWNLSENVKVYSIGGLSNLGKNDTINIYDANNQIVDSVTYAVGFDATGISFNRPTSFTGQVNQAAGWLQSTVGDVFLTTSSNPLPLASYNTLENSALIPHAETVARFDVGNPGYYPVTAVPEPQSYAMLLAGLAALGAMTRRRQS